MGKPASPSRSFSPTAQRSLTCDEGATWPVVTLKSGTFYPIIYRKRIEEIGPRIRAGDIAEIHDGEGNILGYGLVNPKSEMVVRILRHGQEPPRLDFWRQRLEVAAKLRRETLQLDRTTNAYRVVHAEGDQLSGLVIDRFGDVLSAEAFSLGMFQRGDAILAELAAMLGTRHTLLRTSPQFVSQEGYSPDPRVSAECPERVTIEENGTRFLVEFAGGHKTGFFCDQRDNRQKLTEFTAGKTVLDLCCYSGGFSVHAMNRGGAAEVTGVDLDEGPLALARENAKLNRQKVHFVQSDAFAYMRDMLRNGRQYDVVVLDPPKLIRTRVEIEEGTKKHYDLNRLAVQLVRPGGLLLTCTCAGLLPEAEFLRVVYSAAKNARPAEDAPGTGIRFPSRHVKVIGRTGAASDHPVSGSYPESDYLKAVWMIVD